MSKSEVTLAQREQVTLFTKELAALLRRITGHRAMASAPVSASLANQVEAMPIRRDAAHTHSSVNIPRSSP